MIINDMEEMIGEEWRVELLFDAFDVIVVYT